MQVIDYREAVDLVMSGGRDDIQVMVPRSIALMSMTEVRQMARDGAIFAVLDADPKGNPPPKPQPGMKTARKKRVDTGKIIALHKAGRSVQWIADDMRISTRTVYKYIKEMEDKNHDGDNHSHSGTDGIGGSTETDEHSEE